MKAALAEKYGPNVVSGVSTYLLHDLNFANFKIDQVDRYCLHQASSHPLLPEGGG
jgi:hypothetical protein